MEFLNSKFMKELKSFNEGRYLRLKEIYKKENINDNDLAIVLEIFLYGRQYMHYSPLGNCIDLAMEKFITKHIEIAKFEFIWNIYNLIGNKAIKTFVQEISTIFYVTMFRVLANTNNFNYWLENINFYGLKYSVQDEERKYLANNLIKNNLLYNIESPVYNLIILYTCGIVLNNKDFSYLYNKSKYLFSNEFEKNYNYELEATYYGLYMLDKLNIKFHTVCRQIRLQLNDPNFQLNNPKYLYNLLKLRKEHYGVPEDLMPLYLAEDLLEE